MNDKKVLSEITDKDGLASLEQNIAHVPEVTLMFEMSGPDPLVNKIQRVLIGLKDQAGSVISYALNAETLGREALASFLLRLFAIETVYKISHDLKLALSFLYNQHGKKRFKACCLVDTMLASQICNCGNFSAVQKEISNKVDWVFPKYTLTDCFKHYLGEETTSEEIPALLFKLWDILRELLKRNKLERVAAIEFAAILSIVEKEVYGVPFDASTAREKREELSRDILVYERDLDRIVCEQDIRLAVRKHSIHKTFNPHSIMDVQNVLKEMGYYLESFDDAALNSPELKGVEFASLLLKYRKAYRMHSFVDSCLKAQHPEDDRIHGSYDQIKPSNTGRMAGHSPNLQQIPSQDSIRGLFKTERGRKLVIADYAAMELRLAAEICEEPIMIDAFRAGQDIHRQTASIISGKELGLVTAEDRQRAKASNFGLIYGCSEATLSLQAKRAFGVEINYAAAQKIKGSFFKNYPQIQRFHKEQCQPKRMLTLFHEYNAENGYSIRELVGVRTLSGRLRIWPELEGQTLATFTKMANTPIQGTGACILKIAMANCYNALLDRGWEDVWIILSKHDEIVLEAPEELAEEAAMLLKECMERAGESLLSKVPLLAETEILDCMS